MKTLRHNQRGFAAALPAALAASSLFDRTIERRTQTVINDVRARGDAALVALTRKYDGARLTPARFRVTEPTPAVEPALRRAVRLAQRNITAFSRRSLPRAWGMRNAQGGRIGEKFDPIGRVGIYIPAGTAPLASTALMTIVLAKVAGCPEIVVCTPPGRDGQLNPALLYAVRTAGATEIYRVGGAQAIAALALGTRTIPKVDKIFGPGNAYVVAAKRLLFGYAAMDLLPGPSEVLILTDNTAVPAQVAADLLAQAEHGTGEERVWLVTTSARVLAGTKRELARQLPRLPRSACTRRVLARGSVAVLARDLAQAVDIANRFAPEHLEIMTSRPASVAKRISTAGAVFLGRFTPTVLGDYVAGPSHTLPTGGAGRAWSGLTVDQFQRRTSLIEYSRSSLRNSLPAVEAFGRTEGLTAHVESARIRLRTK
ncbi:histidinol dehydrogenase [bacterium]|nr:histidinol dehydrogenase [bacterium]